MAEPVADHDARERHFAEELGLLLEEHGGMRMVGRVLGRLLLCEPAHQTAAELADYLQASRGALSTTTRALITAGFIEKVTFPGQRATYFRIKQGAWTGTIQAQWVQIRLMRELADRAQALAEGHDASVHARVLDFRDFFQFWEQQLPVLLERWLAERGGR